MKYRVFVCTALLIVPISQLATQPRGNNPLDAQYEALVKEVQKAYRSLDAYQDSGCVTAAFYSQDHVLTQTSVKPYKIAFKRRGGFRYEFWDEKEQKKHHPYIVHESAGGKVTVWWGLESQVEESRNLSLALAGPAGISGGSAITIPRMLMSKRLGFARPKFHLLNRMEGVRSIETDTLDEQICHKVRGSLYGNPGTIWIDQASLMLLRVDQTNPFDEFYTKETMRIYPKVNQPISAEELMANIPDHH